MLPAYLLVIVLLNGCTSEKPLNSDFSQEEITMAIRNDQWDFNADYVMPTYGRTQYITGTYFVKCRKDSLSVALPYFGKLNSPAGATNSNPLDFRTSDIKIEKQEKKKGKWIVTISTPNTEARTLTFTFFDNGTGQLTIIMTNRSGISYSGKVGPAKS